MLPSLVTGDYEQDLATMNKYAGQLMSIMAQRPDIARKMNYIVNVKDHRGFASRFQLLDYEVDDLTFKLLQECYQAWSSYPSLFSNWMNPSPLQDPWAQIARECLDAEQANV